MAAPTNVRVEAKSPTSTLVRWSYSGTHSISVYRSTDGVSYAITGDPVAVGTVRFKDEDLTTETKYWYKLSDDDGATFSSVVTVYTHACGTANSTPNTTSFDRLTGDKELPHKHIKRVINDMQRKIENWILQKDTSSSEPCDACAEDGRIILDCTNGCQEFEVVVDQDINSISTINCKEPPTVHWQCPADAPAGVCEVCGWAAEHGFDGDECVNSLIPAGKTATSGGTPPRTNPGGGRGGGGGGGGTSCECTPDARNTLTIKCCSSDCSMSCSSTKVLNIKICGGKGPYTISGTGSINIKKRDGTAVGASTEVSAGETLVITPPTNSGSGHAGVAYIKQAWQCASCSAGGVCNTLNAFFHTDYGCNDNDLTGCVNSGHTVHSCTGTTPDASGMNCNGATATCLPTCAASCSGVTNTWDCRDAAAIAAGCNPCGVSVADKVITATDALGNSVVKTVNA